MSLVSRIIARIFKGEIRWQAYQLFQEYQKQEDDRREESRRITAEFSVGTPVICISNEWEDPVIGFVSHIEYITKARNPVPVVMDYLSGQELMVMGVVYDFTRQRLDAFLKLAPYERWVMVRRYGFHHYGKDLTIEELLEMSMNPKPLLTAEQVHDKLIGSDFYDRHVKFIENLEKDQQVRNH